MHAIYIYIYIYIYIITVLVVTKSLCGFVANQEQHMESAQYLHATQGSQTNFHGIKYMNLYIYIYIYIYMPKTMFFTPSFHLIIMLTRDILNKGERTTILYIYIYIV